MGATSTLGLDAFFGALPSNILIRLLFIALHIICVRRRPEAPTIPPIATSNGSPTAIPAIPPATPLRELSSEIVIGISAPPTRIAKATPKNAERIEIIQIQSGMNTIAARVAIRVTATISECAFHTTGFCGRSL